MGNLCSKSGRISKRSKTSPRKRGKHSRWQPVILRSEDVEDERGAKSRGAHIIKDSEKITDTSNTLNGDEVETSAGSSSIKIELTVHPTNKKETEKRVRELSGTCMTD